MFGSLDSALAFTDSYIVRHRHFFFTLIIRIGVAETLLCLFVMKKFNYFVDARKPQEAVDARKVKEASNVTVFIDRPTALSGPEALDEPPKYKDVIDLV